MLAAAWASGCLSSFAPWAVYTVGWLYEAVTALTGAEPMMNRDKAARPRPPTARLPALWKRPPARRMDAL